ncbi:MAG TPA: PQQ-binding-like beta-propeller repeat protein [Polyangia bacterium]|nr:PQQ-binding-like beta-propeller repeat protein [Polyangia bacterium]
MNRSALIVSVTAALSTMGCAPARVPGMARDAYVAPVDVLQVRWRRHLTEDPLIEYKPQEFARAATDGKRVFIGSSGGVMFALDVHDGQKHWDHKLGGSISGQPRFVADTGLVYVGCDDGILYALDAITGETRWTYKTRGPIASTPVFANDLLYFTSGENRVYALDARSGKWKWQYDREAPEAFTIRGYPAPLVLNGRVYVGFSDGYLACLAAASGDVTWARSLAGEATRFMDVDSTPLYYRDTLFVSAYSSGVYALDPKDGSTKWRYDVEGAGSVTGKGGRLYFTAAKAGLHALDMDGRLLWRQSLSEGGELSEPTLVNRYVLVSSSGATGGTYIADAASGRLYQFFFPGHGVSSAPMSDGKNVYVLSNGGYFYALALNK